MNSVELQTEHRRSLAESAGSDSKIMVGIEAHRDVEAAKEYMRELCKVSPKNMPESERDKYYTQLGLLVDFVTWWRNRQL